jgi:DNA-binding NarL/FixJ family response regulator
MCVKKNEDLVHTGANGSCHANGGLPFKTGTAARKKAIGILGRGEGPATAIQDHVQNSPALCLHHWCIADPGLVGAVIGADVVLIEACGDQMTGQGPSKRGALLGPRSEFPDALQRPPMGRRLVQAELTQISFPGLECLRWWKKKRPQLPVIMFSEEANLQICMRCFLVGADGYFVTTGNPEAFRSLINDAVEGWKPFSREIQQLMAERLAWYSLTGRASDLTQTEAQILWCFASGLSDKDITELRKVFPATIHSLTCSIFRKLKVHRRADAVRAVLRL